MGAKRAGKSQATAWVLLVVAVPVLYVLTFPPIFYVCGWGKGLVTSLNAYGKPYKWLARSSALCYPLEDYRAWWFNVVRSWKVRRLLKASQEIESETGR